MPFPCKPILIFWETTRACTLSCVHCRASAITEPLPGELSREEGRELIEQVTFFGKPYPTIIFTGGDPLKRKDLFELLIHAAELDINFAVSPAVSELLTQKTLSRLKHVGASSVSISLDGSTEEVHDSIRREPGTFKRTIEAIKDAQLAGLNLQVNTAVMRRNLRELPSIFSLIKGLGVKTWEVFFLIRVGRGGSVEDLTPHEYESACNFLYDASHYGVTIRTVEAPFIRRVAKQRASDGSYWQSTTYLELRNRLIQLEGDPNDLSTLRPVGTLDGDGIIFIAHDGTIHPGGLLPISLGNVKNDSLIRVYRENQTLQDIRQRKMLGRCGVCDYKEICGGSRARAFSYSGDPLSSDPACIHVSPQVATKIDSAV
ncbi:MAG TPA: TIGR04053 family radical SAM/SPASM domain-containing protein [Nitrososphaerales archaeon]|nr:TIGR04053 family radical SAM/SPASM domain-containing protein [Nitrososphaerales archaeon]